MPEFLTYTVASAMITLASALFSWPIYWFNRNVSGTLFWAISCTVAPVALLLVSIQSMVPFFIGIVVTNHLFLLSTLLMIQGTRLFFGRPQNYTLFIVLSLSFSLPFLYFSYIQPGIDHRIITISCMFIISSILMMHAVSARGKGNYTIGALFIYLVMGMTISIMIYRIFYVLSIDKLGDTLSNHPINIIVAGLAYFASYGLTLSFYMLCHEHQLQHIRYLRQQAEEETEQKSRFIASLSHELHTPLNAIVGKAQLIALNTDREDIKYDCSLIVDAGMALSSMAQQILEHSRLEHSDIALEKQDVALNLWLEHIVDTLAPLLKEKSLYIRIELSNYHGKYYRFDQGKIRQVLTNLLANAIKYSDAGTILLRVEIHPATKKIRFNVIDQGIGIAESDLPNLMQPFSRALNSANREGSGLGLALSQRILNMMNSELHFHSELNKGSHFYFEIEAEPGQQSAATNIAIEPTEPLIILLIEDIELNRLVTQGMLQQDKHIVIFADSAAQAMQICLNRYVDLILLDMNLPDQNGLEFYQALHNRHVSPPITLVLTADISADLKQQCLAAGIKDVLHKPITLTSLRSSIWHNVIQPRREKRLRQYANIPVFMQLAAYFPETMVQRKLNSLEAELEKLLEQVKNTWSEQGDLKAALHRITSLAATLGLEYLADTCYQLEKQPEKLQTASFDLLSRLARYSTLALNTKVKQLNEQLLPHIVDRR